MGRTRARSFAVAGALIVVAMIGAFLLLRPAAQEAGPAPVAPTPAAAPPGPASRAPETPSRPPVPSLEIEAPTLVGEDPQGQRLWEMRAATLTTTDGVVTAEQVSGQILRQGAVAVRFAAPVALYDQQARVITMPRGASGATADGRRFSGGRVEIRIRDDRVIVTGGVRLIQGEMVVRAARLESDLHLRRVRLSGGIEVVGIGQ